MPPPACKLHAEKPMLHLAFLLTNEQGLGMAVTSSDNLRRQRRHRPAMAFPTGSRLPGPLGQTMTQHAMSPHAMSQHSSQHASQQMPPPMPFNGYRVDGFHDEMFDDAGEPRPDCQPLFEHLQHFRRTTYPPAARGRSLDGPAGHHVQRLRRPAGTERIIPFDIVPRIIHEQEWSWIERGLKQRITRAQHVHRRHLPRADESQGRRRARATGRDGEGFRPQCVGLKPPRGHLVPHHGHRPGARQRRPVLRARRQPACPPACRTCWKTAQLMKQTFPQLFERVCDPAGRRLSRAGCCDALQYSAGATVAIAVGRAC